MSDYMEGRALRCLNSIHYAKNTWHAARAKQLYRHLVSAQSWTLTDSERGDLWFLIWHYRKQVNDPAVIAHADSIVNGALSLFQKGA